MRSVSLLFALLASWPSMIEMDGKEVSLSSRCVFQCLLPQLCNELWLLGFR